jgi:hypothetical protein
MIQFLLVVYLGGTLIDQTQRFNDLDRCLYFAEKLSAQSSVPTGDDKRAKIVAICKPVPRLN